MLYEYECGCGKKFEAFNNIEERKTSACPVCNRLAKKVITKNALNFFPVGWWHNIASKPIFARTKEELARECYKRWTPTNKPWPEFLDGISNPGVPNDIRYDGAAGYKGGLSDRRTRKKTI